MGREQHAAAGLVAPPRKQMAINSESPHPGSGNNPTKPTSECNNSNTTPPAAKKIISIVVMSTPLLYVSLLHVSPSSLFNDTKFWFLVSNAIILIVATDSGMFAGASSDGSADIYEEYVKHDRWRSSATGGYPVLETATIIQYRDDDPRTCLALVPVEGAGGDSHQEEGSCKATRYCRRSTSELAAPLEDGTDSKKEVVLQRSTTEKSRVSEEESEYSTMSDEELNRRVEEFIRRFNMEIRRQQVANARDSD